MINDVEQIQSCILKTFQLFENYIYHDRKITTNNFFKENTGFHRKDLIYGLSPDSTQCFLQFMTEEYFKNKDLLLTESIFEQSFKHFFLIDHTTFKNNNQLDEHLYFHVFLQVFHTYANILQTIPDFQNKILNPVVCYQQKKQFIKKI